MVTAAGWAVHENNRQRTTPSHVNKSTHLQHAAAAASPPPPLLLLLYLLSLVGSVVAVEKTVTAFTYHFDALFTGFVLYLTLPALSSFVYFICVVVVV